MTEYLCLKCLKVTGREELTDGKCPRCKSDNLMQTYNASDSRTITSADLYK